MTDDGAGALLRELVAAEEAGRPAVLATVVHTCHSVPRHAGSKMLVYGDGQHRGTIGGGRVEQRVAVDAVAVLASGRSRLVRYDLAELAGADPGTCGGEMTIYLEPYLPPPTVLVVGCGNVGRAVVELAHWLGLRVIAVDDRPEMLTGQVLPGADVRLPGPVRDALRSAGITERTHVVLTTRSTQADVEALSEVLTTAAGSIGVLGGKRRWQTTREALLSAGVSEAALARVAAPIGLDLGGEDPREIALAILAAIVAAQHQKARP